MTIIQTASFRFRLLVAFAVIIMLTLAASFWYFHTVFDRSIQAEARRDAINQLNLMAMALENLSWPNSMPDFNRWLAQASAPHDMTVAYLVTAGERRGQSLFNTGPSLPDALELPEVRDALSGRLGLHKEQGIIGGQERLVVARTVKPQTRFPEGVLRLSMPIASAKERGDALMGGLLLGATGVLALGVIISMLLARQLTMQISSMSHVAEAIGRGDYARRLRLYPGKEFISLANSINQMADSIQAQIQTITVQKEQLIAILDNMKEGVMLLGVDGRIRAVNRALTKIFPGIETAQGRTPLEAIMEPRFQQACEEVLSTLGSPSAGPHSLQLEPRRGQVYDVGIVPLREHQAGLGAVAVFHDISRLKHLERIRRDFVANVSHELRTPLTSIKGYAETLHNDENIPKPARGFLEVIVKNANHMAKIVGDLLSLSRLEAGQDILEPCSTDAVAALNSAYRECEPLARDRRVTMVNDIPKDIPPVMADSDRLVQVFRNLLENAFRYSPAGGTVTVTAEHDGDEVIFGVSDNGPGIPAHERDKIFERFYRVEKHRTKSSLPGSSGLGLAITKHIVERHHGRIWVVSPARNSDSGATFLFTIPAATDMVPCAEAEGESTAAKTPHATPGSPATPVPGARKSGELPPASHTSNTNRHT